MKEVNSMSPRLIQPFFASMKFVAYASSGTIASGNLIIPATSFKDDQGNVPLEFPSNYAYYTLIINGIPQENSVATISASQLVISGGSVLDGGEPIILEFGVNM